MKKFNYKYTHKHTIAFIILLVLILGFKTYDISAAPRVDCFKKTQELQDKARQLYSKEADQVSKLNPKSVQGVKARKALTTKIDTYISKGLPNDCKGNKASGWQIGLRVFGMLFAF